MFGLGNKTYEHYNAVAIHLDKRLEELGACRVYELGLGDDDAKWVFNLFIIWFAIVIINQLFDNDYCFTKILKHY